MAIIDISGPIASGMWRYGRPYLDLPVPPVSIKPADRVWMVPTVVLHTPTDARGKVTLDDVQRSPSQQQLTIEPGDAVLIHTGWDRQWNDAGRYLSEMPYVSGDVAQRGYSVATLG